MSSHTKIIPRIVGFVQINVVYLILRPCTSLDEPCQPMGVAPKIMPEWDPPVTIFVCASSNSTITARPKMSNPSKIPFDRVVQQSITNLIFCHGTFAITIYFTHVTTLQLS
jgi:hypothetical protein